MSESNERPPTEILEQLMNKVPDELRPLVAKYGPVVLQWSSEEAWAWVELLATDELEAYRALVGRLEGEQIVAEFDRRVEGMSSLNVTASSRAAVLREAASAITMGVLRIVLIRFGF